MIAMEQFVRLATIISALGITLTAAGCGPATPPSDTSIIARFNVHRTEFGQLLEMFDHDGINGRLGCTDSLDDAQGSQPISPQRCAEYVRIFKTIGCDGAVYYWPGAKAKAQFFMWSVGMSFARPRQVDHVVSRRASGTHRRDNRWLSLDADGSSTWRR